MSAAEPSTTFAVYKLMTEGRAEAKDCKFCGGHLTLDREKSNASFKFFKCDKCGMSNVVPQSPQNSD